VAVIESASLANAHTIVVVVSSGAVITEEWREKVPALLLSWYSGCEGGHALADVVLGRIDASGRLPFSIPTDESHLPPFDINATKITYDKWFGQRLLDRLGVQAAYPLGFGLSYASFKLEGFSVRQSEENESLTLSVKVTNIGLRSGRNVLQAYGQVESTDFPARVLLGFSVVDLDPGEERKIAIQAFIQPLRRWDGSRFALANQIVHVEVGGHAGDATSLRQRYQFRSTAQHHL
jgi:hypothetical protein